ncbi:hypothetical protein Acr_02g0006350 [Actinidia rufa]|uniref:Leucine-rich repeat-containing N-terminal plant-type domain-containing protein n=1 Tax=Actinidia rufa TaxID=165716 RepID=A0A7J0E7P8_9ERIC|nr:hypothetical protein Acr_02g0006350 [Actinidia rufa]
MIFWINVIPVHSQCLNDQKSLLLQLKNSLIFNSAISVKLVNWTEATDCCDWKGVNCDQEGHAIGLDLNSEGITGGINQSSLFSLPFLENLNLANNSFIFAQIPPSFGNLTSLRYLNLSMAGFSGQIPIELSLLTRLAVLDLSSLQFPGTPSLKLENPNLLTLFRNLNKLTELHLDGVNISAKGSEWCQAISSSLPKLRVLSLSKCYLSGPIDISLQNLQFLSEINLGKNNLSAPVPEFFASFPNLTALSLSSSNLYGTFPEKILQVPTLQTLDLENNILVDGSLPEFSWNSNLKKLVLSDTKFSGRLPDSMGVANNTWPKLQIIDLALNNFSGDLPPNSFLSWKAMMVDMGSAQPVLNHLRFEFLNLNNFYYQDTVKVTMKGQELELVKILNIFTSVDFSCNNFTGQIPETVGALKSLYVLNLSHNALTGNEGLCGPPLNTSCREWDARVPVVSVLPTEEGNSDSEAYIYISATVGFVVGLGCFIASLALCNRWNKWYFKHVAQVLERIFHLEEKRRRRNRIERAYRNPIRRL